MLFVMLKNTFDLHMQDDLITFYTTVLYKNVFFLYKIDFIFTIFFDYKRHYICSNFFSNVPLNRSLRFSSTH